jgi:hypothetical protein
MWRTNGDAIIGELQSQIDKFKRKRDFQFNWSQFLFKNAPKKTPDEMNWTEEEVARMEELVKDKARQRLVILESFCMFFISIASVSLSY